ncbi:glucose-1-phosphate thymidylyltransferase RfbA [Prochlorococcus marinus XMU1406]|uniref:glucose-1-phosphate thymidylyltransferase RfbA n=1 Tax=Prochlorococcus marinus TaxID=1219 RepID=UPI001ADCD016|nr:glucose-1-phosphate thymidylyltransferase RfbA [Prochlorococcus marinus]MBO8206820.1 glucose-1-phosphate thymidylyltransferase RfbA [Prochlorococcus marinus XMU1406]MCR8542639.1 glucose-1-phosphate thymidylyltransferase RfbA [Prochlorococcus marinus XMU1427]
MTINRKGIILAGGNGTRLSPLTKAVSKQLLPIYDKPMIFYPLCTLMQGDIREILIICKPEDKSSFKKILGDGSNFGLNIKYALQKYPGGLAEAFLIGEKFISDQPVTLILGDNLFHGSSLSKQMKIITKQKTGGTIFAYQVKDPERYGVVEFDNNENALEIIEKPSNPKSNYAITGLYFYDGSVVKKAKSLKPSKRGELEITDLNMLYLKEKSLKVEIFDKGVAWLDTGKYDSLYEASGYIYALQERQGLKISCPEEIAWNKGWISGEKFYEIAKNYGDNEYGEYLMDLYRKI